MAMKNIWQNNGINHLIRFFILFYFIFPGGGVSMENPREKPTSFFSETESEKGCSWSPAARLVTYERIPTPVRSTASETNQGVHDRIPYFLMNST